MMKTLRRVSTVLLTLFISFALVPVAFAHPLGNFTINQYVGLTIGPEMMLVDYVVDMAEIPAFQEIALLDANGNGQADLTESANYDADKCALLQPDLKLLVNDRPVALTLASSSVEFPAGVGGLPTLRLTCNFQAILGLSQGNYKILFVNEAFPDRIGWNEIVVKPEAVSVQGDYSTTSLSNRLTNYPRDLLSSPLDQRQVEFEIMPTTVSIQSETIVMEREPVSSFLDRNDAFTRLILMDNITLPTLLISLAVAFIWGAMHAMTPGHGKTIVGAYLVGSRGTPKHALYLGLTTTITHTLGVFLFGLITLFAAQYILPETLFPWMTLLSGLFVVGIGANLSIERFRAAGMGSWFEKLKSSRVKSEPGYVPVVQQTSAMGVHSQHRYILTLPQERHHSHYFDEHPHSPEIHAHTHDSHHNKHGHQHDHDHHHSHVHNDHSHMPPEAITWRSLLALGISGGLLPCPSALVVLLGAIALNRIGFGLILVFAFSLGLAGALTAIGLAFLYAGKFLERFPSQGRLINILPAFSALFISVIGLGIVVKALSEVGMI
jgi:nickel/cobalt transporter (NicO) family protein